MGAPRTNERFMSTRDAAELLGVGETNVAKTLRRHGVDRQTVKLWLRADVERVREARLADPKARASDEKRRAAAAARRQLSEEG